MILKRRWRRCGKTDKKEIKVKFFLRCWVRGSELGRRGNKDIFI